MDKAIIAANSPAQVSLEEGKFYYYCACGRSARQPFCDGAHRGTEIIPIVFEVNRSGTEYLCRCKQTANPPYCDGSHKNCPDDQVGNSI